MNYIYSVNPKQLSCYDVHRGNYDRVVVPQNVPLVFHAHYASNSEHYMVVVRYNNDKKVICVCTYDNNTSLLGKEIFSRSVSLI
jgi:hypothetical protein